MRNSRIPFSVGFIAACFQVIFLRRLYAAFAGSEVAVGMGFFAWMDLYGAGGLLLGRYADRVGPRVKVFLAVSAVVDVLSIGAILVSYRLGDLFGYAPGELLQPFLALPASLMLAVPCVGMGFLFALAPVIVRGEEAISRAYSFEAMGGVAGALLTVATAAAGFTGLNEMLVAILVHLFILVPYFVVVPVIAVAGIVCSLIDLDAVFLNAMGRYGNVLVNTASPYSHLMVTLDRGQSTLYVNEMPAGVIGQRATRELPVLLADYYAPPGRLLLIGPDLTAACTIVSATGRKVTLLWRDEKEVNIQWSFVGPCANRKNIKLVFVDPFSYVRQATQKYAGVILAPGPPTSLAASLLWSKEFFENLKSVVLARGIVVSVAGEVTSTLSSAQADFLSIYINTLSEAGFKSTVFPAGPFVFVSSLQGAPAVPDPGVLDAYMSKKGYYFPYASSRNIGYLLTPDRVNYYLSQIKKRRKTFSSIYHPRIYMAAAAFYAEIAKPGLYRIFMKVEKYGMFLTATAMLMALITAFTFFRFGPEKGGAAGAVFAAGFSSMGFVVLLLTLFQAAHGSLYTRISLFNAVYFIAIALGARGYGLRKIRLYEILFFLSVGIGVSLYGLAVVFKMGLLPAEIFYYGANFIVGFLAAAVFRGASAEAERDRMGRWAGVLDFADHTGAAVGAAITALLALPFLGMVEGVFLSFVFPLVVIVAAEAFSHFAKIS